MTNHYPLCFSGPMERAKGFLFVNEGEASTKGGRSAAAEGGRGSGV